MKPYRSLSLIVLLSSFVSTSCSKEAVRPSSSAGALMANSALETVAARPFARHVLAVSGQTNLNEYLRSDVRSRMDEEPIGESDSGFDPATVDSSVQSSGESQAHPETAQPASEETAPQDLSEDVTNYGQPSEAKYHWAKKSFGDAIKARPTAGGVIVLYADENQYDISAIMTLVEQGRDRIASRAEIPNERIQVVFGGYRGVPQVELWIVPQGSPMPEFKTEDRSKNTDHEN